MSAGVSPLAPDSVLCRGSPLIGAIDEVYPATLLAYRGLDGETDCAGYATSVEFLPHTEHPTSYPAANVSATLCVGFDHSDLLSRTFDRLPIAGHTFVPALWSHGCRQTP